MPFNININDDALHALVDAEEAAREAADDNLQSQINDRVVGPEGVGDEHIVIFDGIGGKTVKDGGLRLDEVVQEDDGPGIGLVESSGASPIILKNVTNGNGTEAQANTGSLQINILPDAASDVLDNATDPFARTSVLADKADLVGGVVPTSQIPAVAITEFLGSVNSQAAMLALTGQRGDWCVRTDLSSNFILTGDDASVLSNWTAVAYPGAPVSSVNAQTGVVVLGAADVGADAAGSAAAAQAAAIAACPAETVTSIGALTNGATAKVTPVDADMVGLMDSAASNIWKKLSWANIKATLKAYFDTLYVQTSYSAITLVPPDGVTLTQWTNMPAALSFFNGQGRWFVYADLTNATSINLIQANYFGGAVGSKLMVRYRTVAAGFDTTPANWTPLGVSGDVETLLNTTGGVVTTQSGYINIAPAAKTLVMLMLCGSGGNGADDPIFLSVGATIKYVKS